jgi:ABC-type sugar transport system substrate-binding protein
MSTKATVPMLAALALAAPLFAGSVTVASAADGGLISVIVIDPANPYWLTEGNVAAAEAQKLGYKATVDASKGDTNTESKLIDTAITNKSVAIISTRPTPAVRSARSSGLSLQTSPCSSSTPRSTRRVWPRRSSSPTTRRAPPWADRSG